MSAIYGYGVLVPLEEILTGPAQEMLGAVARKMYEEYKKLRQEADEKYGTWWPIEMDWSSVEESLRYAYPDGNYTHEGILEILAEEGHGESLLFEATSDYDAIDLFTGIRLPNGDYDGVFIHDGEGLLFLEWDKISDAKEPSEKNKQQLSEVLALLGLGDKQPDWDNVASADDE